MSREELAQEIVAACQHAAMPAVGEEHGACVSCIAVALTARDQEMETVRVQRDALGTALATCAGNRGCFSTVEPHDLRCPKSRADSPEKWKGAWVCACGREALDAALAAAKEKK